MATFQSACELIARHWKETKNIDVEPEAIFNYSPTGELSEVFYWFESARVYYKMVEVYDNVNCIPKSKEIRGAYAYVGEKLSPHKVIFDGRKWRSLYSEV